MISEEIQLLITKVLSVIAIIFGLKWVVKIFAGPDGKLDINDFNKLSSFFLFVWAFIYIITKEANRKMPEGSTDHIFSEIWMFFIISALLTVLSMDRVLDTFGKIIDAIVKLRTSITKKSEDEKTN